MKSNMELPKNEEQESVILINENGVVAKDISIIEAHIKMEHSPKNNFKIIRKEDFNENDLEKYIEELNS